MWAFGHMAITRTHLITLVRAKQAYIMLCSQYEAQLQLYKDFEMASGICSYTLVPSLYGDA
jgi:hypothetical protein